MVKKQKVTVKKKKSEKKHLFQPGESGNPKGRPVGSRSLSTIMKERLRDIARNSEGEALDGEKTFEDVFVNTFLYRASIGDAKFARMLLEYSEGKPVSKNEIKLEGGLKFEEGDIRNTINSLPKEKQVAAYSQLANILYDLNEGTK